MIGPDLAAARHEKLGAYNIYVDENTEVSVHRGVQAEKTALLNCFFKRVKWLDRWVDHRSMFINIFTTNKAAS